MKYNDLWNAHQKALKHIESLEKELKKFKHSTTQDMEVNKNVSGNKQNKSKSRGRNN